MKHTIFVPIALCLMAWPCAPAPAIADASQPGGILEVSLPHSTVTLGEPILLKYRITNPEDRQLDVNMGKDKRGWLTMHLVDASGHSVLPVPKPIPVKGGLSVDGEGVEADNFSEGYAVVSQTFQIPQPGKYRLSLSTHLTYSWDDAPGETVADDEKFFLTFTVTARNPQKLLVVAEGLRQAVLHDKLGGNKLATEELVSMRDPVCLPVWQKLALDPTLDPWRALYLARQLADVESVPASDILAAMQTVAPERWSLTGASPQDELERMQRNSSAATKQHISEMSAARGVFADHAPIGSAN